MSHWDEMNFTSLKPKPQTSPVTWLVALGLLGLLAYSTLERHCATNEYPKLQAASAVIDVGTHAYMKANSENAPVAVDKESLYEFIKALKARDQVGVDELLVMKVFMVSNGTHILVIDKDGYGALKVRILEGKHEGSSGWTDPTWITMDKVASN